MKRMHTDREIRALAVDSVEQKENLKVFEHIVDKDGHQRFVEGNIDLYSEVVEGITKDYGKWSLSGSHLMFVLVLNLANTTALTNGSILATATLPKWIHDKIVKLWSSNAIDTRGFSAYNDDWSTQSVACYLSKSSNNRVSFVCTTTATLTKDRKVRIQFDLLIDNA